MIKNNPKVLYSNMINMAGLYSRVPIRCTRHKNPDTDSFEWWDSSGNYDCHPVEPTSDSVALFTSESKRDVEIWTLGAIAMLNRINSLSPYN